MLFSVYPQITQNYFILCFLACLGILQWVAARRRQTTLSLFGPWAFGWPGMALGLGLAAGSFAWFFTTPGLFSPGLAGGELFPLFLAGSGTALLLTRLAGTLWQKITSPAFKTEPRPSVQNPKSRAKPPGGEI